MLDILFSSSELRNLFKMPIRKQLLQFTLASYSIISTYMLWKLIGLLLNNDAPIVVVLSESMYPGFERGDILFLSPKKCYNDYTTGDMIVFQINKNEIPIVHRGIKRFNEKILTKGDNNMFDDVALYKNGKRFLVEKDVLSRVIGCLPYFGMVTIWVNAIPHLKYIALALIAISVMLNREE